MPKFAGKIAIITGAASGIGRACAIEFASEGALVCLVDIDANGLEQTKQLVAGADSYLVDVSDNSQVLECTQQIVRKHGQIDILINNAGVNANHTIEVLSESQWDDCMAVNLKSYYNFCYAAWPHLKSQGQSAIVNVSSIMGIVGGVGAPAYCTAKAGIIMLSKCLAKDGAKDGIRVNAVCPGFIDTPILRQGYEDNPNFEKLKQEVAKSQPMGRIGSPHEVAKAIAFLASQDASLISGASLTIDGALTATFLDG